MAEQHFLVVGVDERHCTIDSPDKSGKHDDSFTWRCHHGELEIVFDKTGTPFKNGQRRFTAHAHENTQPSGQIDPQATPGPYYYSVTVTLPTGQKCHVDPRIILDSDKNHWSLVVGGAAALAGALLIRWGIRRFE